MLSLHEYFCKCLVAYYHTHYLFFITTFVFLGKEQFMLLKKETKCKEL